MLAEYESQLEYQFLGRSTLIIIAGATFPSLHQEDFDALGIDMASYGAQSVTPCYTASGLSINRLFELFVSVLDNDGKQLVDPNNAVYPLSHKYLGGLCPVTLVSQFGFWSIAPYLVRYEDSKCVHCCLSSKRREQAGSEIDGDRTRHLRLGCEAETEDVYANQAIYSLQFQSPGTPKVRQLQPRPSNKFPP